jgi:four helix bundle protein
VWQKSHALVLKAYELSATLNHPRTFFLRDQLIRAAVSVPANLAEGCGRAGDREFRKFVRIASGSASELEYHLLLAHDLGFLMGPDHEQMVEAAVEIKRMLSGLASELTERLADS